MSRDDVEHWLKQTILELQDGLSREQIVASASFYDDLGFDSLTFEKLVAALETTSVSRDLSQWYFNVARHGTDTFGSLVEFLVADADATP